MGHIYPWYFVVYTINTPDGRETRQERFDCLADADRVFNRYMCNVQRGIEDADGVTVLTVELFGCDCLASCRPDSHPNAPLQTSPETC